MEPAMTFFSRFAFVAVAAAVWTSGALTMMTTAAPMFA
jgi:hypothetical protein